MTSGDRSTALTALARTGFSQLTEADTLLGELEESVGVDRADAMQLAQRVADPDRALRAVLQVARRDAGAVRRTVADAGAWRALWDIVGPPTASRSSTSGIPTSSCTCRGGSDPARRADHARGAAGIRGRRRRLRSRRDGCRLGGPAGEVPATARPDRSVRPRPGRPGGRHRRGLLIARRPRGAALEASLSVARARVAGRGPGASPASRWRRRASRSSRWARPARASSTTSATST